jgi:penicillin-binding protein 2
MVQNKRFYDVVKQGMEAVMLRGTGASLRSTEFTQLAKTGTAQVPQGKDNSIFTLIAPADKPKIVVVSVMEHAGFGATWAGPACTTIAEKYITGNLKRENLYKKLTNASFMGEYKRQWYKKHGKPAPDSATLKRLKDSIALANSIKAELKNKKKLDSLAKKKSSTSQKTKQP